MSVPKYTFTPTQAWADETLSAVPDVLKLRPQWVIWRWENRTNAKGETKSVKVLYNPKTGGKGMSNNPDTWVSFAVALRAATSRNMSGVGYVFASDDPFAGVDFDDCVDEHGVIAPWAAAEIAKLNSYSEISPSGKGVKVFVEGELPDSIGNTPFGDGAIEMYSERRYFTVTGNVLPGSPTAITHANGTLQDLYNRVRKPRAEAPLRTRLAGGSHEREFALRVLRDEAGNVATAPDGGKHVQLRNSAIRCAGYMPHISESEIESTLFGVVAYRAADADNARKTIRDGILFGSGKPLDIPQAATPLDVYRVGDALWCATHHTPLFETRNAGVWGCKGCLGASDKRWWKDGDPVLPPPVETGGTSVVDAGTMGEAPPPRRRLWLTEDEVDLLQPPRWLVRDTVPAGEVTVVFGPSDAGKTFVIVDLTMRVAQHYPVMYVAAEDGPGVKIRKQAWQAFHKRTNNGNFMMWNDVLNLNDATAVDAFIQDMNGSGVRLIVLDTLSQCATGVDENSAKEMGVVLRNCNRIAHQCNAAVVIIHHTTKVGNEYRGSGAIKGNTYGFLKVENEDGTIVLDCVRIKNTSGIKKRRYKLVDVAGTESVVIQPDRAVLPSDRLTKSQYEILLAIGEVSKALGDAPSGELQRNTGLTGNSYYRPLNVLLSRGLAAKGANKMSGFYLTQKGRDYLKEEYHQETNVATNDAGELAWFEVNATLDTVEDAGNVDGRSMVEVGTSDASFVSVEQEYRTVMGYDAVEDAGNDVVDSPKTNNVEMGGTSVVDSALFGYETPNTNVEIGGISVVDQSSTTPQSLRDWGVEMGEVTNKQKLYNELTKADRAIDRFLDNATTDTRRAYDDFNALTLPTDIQAAYTSAQGTGGEFARLMELHMRWCELSAQYEQAQRAT